MFGAYGLLKCVSVPLANKIVQTTNIYKKC